MLRDNGCVVVPFSLLQIQEFFISAFSAFQIQGRNVSLALNMTLNMITHPGTSSNGSGLGSQKKQTEATIIVAATQSMGMSYATHLPWPKLKRENGYFETITKRVDVSGNGASDELSRTMNAVIMGFSTWDDNPTKLFSDRINVVITRDPEKVWARLRDDKRDGLIHIATSLEEAIAVLERTYPKRDLCGPNLNLSNGQHGDGISIGRIFVIGGAELCRGALKLPWINRLLLTRVMNDFKCDTLFPLVLDGLGNEQWHRQSDEIFEEWGGRDVPIGVQCENGLKWEAYMFERRSHKNEVET